MRTWQESKLKVKKKQETCSLTFKDKEESIKFKERAYFYTLQKIISV
jgi:hypothetical protein